MSPATPATTALSSTQDLYAWTLRADAVAPCFIRDALTMQECNEKGFDFFWIGSVPCRTVCIVCMIVGVQAFENRVVYAVDDGTGVIECVEKRDILPPESQMNDKSSNKPVLQVSLKPVAYVGSQVKIIGKVAKWHETRQIKVDSIIVCTSANEEPLHWRHVASLHSTRYSLAAPFTVPQPTPTVIDLTEEPQSSNLSTLSPSIPPKLRHPSRLHSRDLTSATFMRYLKHYMDNYAVKDDLFLKCPTFGYTLSHLRRVPELHLMAKRVVQAEAKRRTKEKKKTEKGSSSHGSEPDISPGPMAQKMKRLFAYAIVKLHEEGTIVLWEGPCYQADSVLALNPDMLDHSNRLWKLNSMNETSIFSNTSAIDDDGLSMENLSEPDSEEEAYISVTSEYLAEQVEACMERLMEKSKGWHRRCKCPKLKNTQDSTTPDDNAYEPWCTACPHPPGPIIREIQINLGRHNSKWDRVGEWAIEEALDILRRDGRAWETGQGRWELSV